MLQTFFTDEHDLFRKSYRSFVEELPIARQYRDARLLTIGGGSSEVMKEILVKRLGLA